MLNVSEVANAVTNWVFRRQRFCCCLPARLGAGLLSLLTMLLAGLLMVILWFEVATNDFMSRGEKAVFVTAGLVETLLFIASILGLIGTCARKQSFVVVYASFLYFHFLLNFGVAVYFLGMITHAANADIVKFCQDGLQDAQSKSQCTGLLRISKGVFWVVTLAILAIELYCAIIVTRYVNQLRFEKQDVRSSRIMKRKSAYDAFHQRFTSGASDKEGLLQDEFNPYEVHSPKLTSAGSQRENVPSRVGEDLDVKSVQGLADDTSSSSMERRKYQNLGQTPLSPPPSYSS